MAAVKTLNLKDGSVLEIHHDPDPESPRNWDNIGIVAVFHNKYDFGDKVDFSFEDFGNWSGMQNHIEHGQEAVALIPIFMLDHSGITIRTVPFGQSFDSGQIGFIYMNNDKLNEMGITQGYGDGLFDDESDTDFRTRLQTYLENEIKSLDHYLTGEVYGYQIKNTDGTDGDSCWGFYRSDFKTNGILDHVDEDLIVDLGEF